MQTTLIKIKFMPLIKQMQKDTSKYCLQIVPDVSCIDNLDKIDWNEEKKLIEYCVPITYKIILTKSIKEHTEDKIYYSCIDLRRYTNSSLACGDIPKAASDCFALRTVTTDFEQSIVLTKPYELREKRGCYKEKMTIDKNNFVCFDGDKSESIRIAEDISDMCLSQEVVGKGDVIKNTENTCCTYYYQSRVNLIDNNNKRRKPICTESTVSKETITDVMEINKSKEQRRKLTIASVCTLDTTDVRGLYKEAIRSNSKIYVDYELKYKSDDETNNVAKYRNHNKTTKRILPEMRVARFMMKVENEILPLKIMLNQIYEKCASLGFLWKSNLSHTLQSNNSNFVNVNQRLPKSNRVVYSIVFKE